MVDNQSTQAYWPAFCWGCLTDTQIINAKLYLNYPILDVFDDIL